MSMIPIFPSLRPTIGSSICIDADAPCDEESELREIEKEHVAWVRRIRILVIHFHKFWTFFLQLKSIQQTAFELAPFGKVPPTGPDGADTDDEGKCEHLFVFVFIRNVSSFYIYIIEFQYTIAKKKRINLFFRFFLDLLSRFIISAGNDDSEDSESRDEEEEEDEMDAIDANQTPNINSAATLDTIDTSSPDIFNQMFKNLNMP